MNTALAMKLRLHKFSRILLQNKPEGVDDLDGLSFDTVPAGRYDLVFVFVFSLDEMERTIRRVHDENLLNDGGCLYLAYPKKGNKVYRQHIDRDSIFPFLGVDDSDGFVGGMPLKFSLMVAFNNTFTLVGLRRFEERSRAVRATDGRVEDYAGKVPMLRAELDSRPEILTLYDGLTPGYQKDWARHVYSAKTDITREKRLLEMADILTAGYKSKDAYRRREK
jgi:hypothetical protein